MVDRSYNGRLFSKGLRKRWHSARFHWLQRVWAESSLQAPRVMEVGCFDGKTLDFLPPVGTYAGFDAGWGGGLEIGRRERSAANVSFHEAQAPEDLFGLYDAIICMETLEHVPLKYTEAFVAKFSKMAPMLFVTVPVEFGPLAAAKHFYKKITGNRPDSYRISEFVSLIIGNSNGIIREEGGHKGFDYRYIVNIIENYYKIVEVKSIPFPALSPIFGSSVGIIARK